MSALRNEDRDAWSFFRVLVARSQGPRGLDEHHVFPVRVLSKHRMGELKARSKQGQMYRLYYGESDQQTNLIVGLFVRAKKVFLKGIVTTQGQDHQIKVARNIFVTWLKANGMTSGA